MNRRALLLDLILIGASSLLGACNKSSTESSAKPAASATASVGAAAAVAPSKTTTFTVGHDLWIGYSGVFLAQELGYFKDAGLEVKLKPFSNPGDTLPALASGQLDIGLTTLQNLALLSGNGTKGVVAIALLDSSNGADAIVAKKTIKSVQDLKGKTVAATIGEVNHFLLLMALKKNGLSEKDIKLTSMSADDAGAAFVAGKVDAAVTWEPWVTKATKAGANLVFTSRDVPDTIMDSIAVKQSNVEANAAAYKAFVMAVDKGVGFLRSDPEKARPIIGKFLNAPADDVKGMLEGDKIYDHADNQKLFGSDASAPAFQSMQSVLNFANELKLIKETPTAASLFQPSLIR